MYIARGEGEKGNIAKEEGDQQVYSKGKQERGKADILKGV
jgi:hypothetical protein